MRALMLVVATLLASLGLLITHGNYVGVVRAARLKKSFSMIPLFGGVLMTAGLLLLGGTFARFWVVPLLLDLGSIPLVASTIVFQVRLAIRRRGDSNPCPYAAIFGSRERLIGIRVCPLGDHACQRSNTGHR